MRMLCPHAAGWTRPGGQKLGAVLLVGGFEEGVGCLCNPIGLERRIVWHIYIHTRLFLSGGNASPANSLTRLTHFPYAKVNGNIVANNWDNLTDGDLLSAISIDENLV